jgi:hypothetical protein
MEDAFATTIPTAGGAFLEYSDAGAIITNGSFRSCAVARDGVFDWPISNAGCDSGSDGSAVRKRCDLGVESCASEKSKVLRVIRLSAGIARVRTNAQRRQCLRLSA